MREEMKKIKLDEFAKKFLGIKMKPYQKQIIQMSKKGGKITLRMRPCESPKLKMHKRHLLEELYTSIDLNNEIRGKIETASSEAFLTGTSLVEFNPHRPTMIIIDDPIVE